MSREFKCAVCGKTVPEDGILWERDEDELSNVKSINHETIQQAKEAIGLLNCMIYSGERHTGTSQKIVRDALEMLRKLE